MNKMTNESMSENMKTVSDFYAQSFEQLSEFYKQSFEQLLTTVSWFGAIAGFIAPAIVWFFVNRVLTKNYDELKSSTEDEIKKIKKENERKFNEEIEKLGEEFDNLEKKIEIGQNNSIGLSYSAFADLPVDKDIKFNYYIRAARRFIKSKNEDMLMYVLGMLVDIIHLLDISQITERDSEMNDLIRMLKSHNLEHKNVYSQIIAKIQKELSEKLNDTK